MRLLHPWLLLLLLLWLPLIFFRIRQSRKGTPALTVSTTAAFAKLPVTWKRFADLFAFILRLVAIGAVIVAIARPQRMDAVADKTINGTDIVLALDISESMMYQDMSPNRFEAARAIASDFASKRENDNVALVAFAGESLTMMPLTNDPTAIIGAIDNLRLGVLGDGTAIGDGLVTAINRIISGKAKSKSVILITDGSNNAGEVDPLTAAQIAKEKGVKVYTIAIGQDQNISVGSYFDPYATVSIPIDVETLGKISAMTGGKSFRATDRNMLRDVFKEIDSLQKSEIKTSTFNRVEERFMPWIWLALICLALEVLLRLTVLRRLP